MPAPKSIAVLEAERVYHQYVKPIEHDHQGEYALVTPDGGVYFAPSLLDLARKAHEKPNTQNLLFKVGDIVACHVL